MRLHRALGLLYKTIRSDQEGVPADGPHVMPEIVGLEDVELLSTSSHAPECPRPAMYGLLGLGLLLGAEVAAAHRAERGAPACRYWEL